MREARSDLASAPKPTSPAVTFEPGQSPHSELSFTVEYSRGAELLGTLLALDVMRVIRAESAAMTRWTLSNAP